MRARRAAAGLAYELIAARADLTPSWSLAAAAGGDPDVRTLRGWRRELVGEDLLELLAGNRRLGRGQRLGWQVDSNAACTAGEHARGRTSAAGLHGRRR